MVRIFHFFCKLFLIGYSIILQVAAQGDQQFAYVSSVDGIYQYRVGHSGGLVPLMARPVKGSPSLARLFLDQNTHILYAIDQSSSFELSSTTDHIYGYVISSAGHLSLKTAKPLSLNLAVNSAFIDSASHLLYAFDGYKSLAVYDIRNPTRVQQKYMLLLPVQAQNLITGKDAQSFLLAGKLQGLKEQSTGSRLLQYYSGTRHTSPLNLVGDYVTQQWIFTAAFAGRYLIAGGWNNTLAVYDVEKMGLHLLSSAFVPKGVGGSFLQHIVYCNQSRILYVSAFSQPFSPRSDPPPTAVASYRLGENGCLQLLEIKSNHPVCNPNLFIDKTSRFLYITSQAGNSVDTYKIATDGRLLQTVIRLKIAAPTAMIFFRSVGK